MRVGIVDVDGRNFPNFALMRASAHHKSKGDHVEWAKPATRYDLVLASKVFTFSKDYDYSVLCAGKIVKGGTGYDIRKTLPCDMESFPGMDYALYPQYPFSVQFFSRGCIRHCPFCLVHEKEGSIRPVEPVNLNPQGKWIEVLDNNFFANPEWRDAVEYLIDAEQPVKLHGVDVRIMNEEQAFWLNRLKLRQNIHIAWDMPDIDLTDRIKEMTRYVKPYKITCYVLVGYNSTIEQDLYRLNTLKRMKIAPFVQPYRDFSNERQPSRYELDLARWANRMWLFKSCDFADYMPRKGFRCAEYLKHGIDADKKI